MEKEVSRRQAEEGGSADQLPLLTAQQPSWKIFPIPTPPPLPHPPGGRALGQMHTGNRKLGGVLPLCSSVPVSRFPTLENTSRTPTWRSREGAEDSRKSGELQC